MTKSQTFSRGQPQSEARAASAITTSMLADLQKKGSETGSRAKTPQRFSNVQLVPCRWKRTGWKYIQTEVAPNNRFFVQNNRINSQGYSTFENNYGTKRFAGAQHSEYDETQRFSNTTYSKFYDKTQ